MLRAHISADEADVRTVLMAAQIAALDNIPPRIPTENQILNHLMGLNFQSGMVVALWFDGPMAVRARLESGGQSGKEIFLGWSDPRGDPGAIVTLP